MSIKSFIIFLVLSVVITYGVALIEFATGMAIGPVGLPFGFSQFNFLGGETNNMNLLLDIAFWFVVLFTLKTIISNFLKH